MSAQPSTSTSETGAMSSNHYKLLGLTPDCTEAEIKKAYKAHALASHPDKNTAPNAGDLFGAVQEAYDCLVDPEAREKYDEHPLKATVEDEQEYSENNSKRQLKKQAEEEEKASRKSHHHGKKQHYETREWAAMRLADGIKSRVRQEVAIEKRAEEKQMKEETKLILDDPDHQDKEVSQLSTLIEREPTTDRRLRQAHYMLQREQGPTPRSVHEKTKHDLALAKDDRKKAKAEAKKARDLAWKSRVANAVKAAKADNVSKRPAEQYEKHQDQVENQKKEARFQMRMEEIQEAAQRKADEARRREFKTGLSELRQKSLEGQAQVRTKKSNTRSARDIFADADGEDSREMRVDEELDRDFPKGHVSLGRDVPIKAQAVKRGVFSSTKLLGDATPNLLQRRIQACSKEIATSKSQDAVLKGGMSQEEFIEFWAKRHGKEKNEESSTASSAAVPTAAFSNLDIEADKERQAAATVFTVAKLNQYGADSDSKDLQKNSLPDGSRTQGNLNRSRWSAEDGDVKTISIHDYAKGKDQIKKEPSVWDIDCFGDGEVELENDDENVEVRIGRIGVSSRRRPAGSFR